MLKSVTLGLVGRSSTARRCALGQLLRQSTSSRGWRCSAPQSRRFFCSPASCGPRRQPSLPAYSSSCSSSSSTPFSSLAGVERDGDEISTNAAANGAERLEAFQRMLKAPDDIWLRGSEARKMFKLSRQDLSELGKNYILKDNPYEQGKMLKQYSLKEVVTLALQKHTEGELMKHISERYMPLYFVKDKIYGHYRREDEEEKWPQEAPDEKLRSGRPKLGKMYWYNAPSTTTVEGRQSVMQGLKTNIGICTAKGLVWWWTGSHVMFADLMHSIADVLNYSYRLLELNRSARQRDIFHPYGYAPLRYITADRSFVFLGFVGGICPILSAMTELAHGSIGVMAMDEHLGAPAAVFVISALLEGVAVKTAYHEISSLHSKEFGNTPGAENEQPRATMKQVLRYLREGRDVMSTATFTESSCGVIACLTGLVGIAATWYLQSAVPDIAASLVMGTMVCCLSRFLLNKTGNALLGQTLPEWRVKHLVELMEGHPAVVNVFDVKTELIGTDTVRFKAEVQFNAQAITDRLLCIASRPTTSVDDDADAVENRAVLTARFLEAFPQLQRGLPQADATAWLYRNNCLFYEALALELKDVEKVVRGGLSEFRNVHIDLEPW